MSFVPCPCVEQVLCQFWLTRLGLSTTHINIGQLAWESYQNYTVLCSDCSTSVEGHLSCHKQVSSILQQYKEDELLLVAMDTQYHDSHYKTVHERELS